MLCLTARYREKTLRFDVPNGESLLGSSADNPIVVPLPGVSRVHARLFRTASAIRLVDAGSKNGLRLHGERVYEATLGPGVVVHAGSVALSVEDGPTSDIEVGLPFAKERPGSRARPRETGDARSDTRSGSGSFDDVSAAQALRFIRRLERSEGTIPPRQHSRLLAEARYLLGAESLLVLEATAGDEPAIVLLSGPLPASEVMATLSLEGPPQQTSALLTRIGSTRRLLAAIYPKDSPSTERWQQDFVEYLGEKFRPGSEEARADAAGEISWATSADDLTLPPGMIAGRSPALQNLLEQIKSTLRSRMDVLLLGETGTGKELFARLIHTSGPTPEGPFVPINCAAIPSELLESELFGVQARVATGVDPRVGLFVQANGGTIFLDEIGELAQPLQAKLLRVLQEREVLPIGGSAPRKIDLRVVSASNRDLELDVDEGRFRADLYYRLRGLKFHIPPLRDRREDIPELVLAFAQKAAEEYQKRVQGVSRKALALLVAHDWPGNVRELESEVKRAVLTCPQGCVVDSSHFGTVKWAVARAGGASPASDVQAKPAGIPAADSIRPLQERIDTMEKEAIAAALDAAHGNKSLAARLLGITRNGLAMKLLRFGKKGQEPI